jgi:hypothetical protein
VTVKRKHSHPYAVLALAACAVAAVAAAPAVASASPLAASHGAAGQVQDPIPIAPNEFFSGYVNGHPPGQAIIYTDCFGPITPGETGHPLGDQTIEVEPANGTVSAIDLGYTGTEAHGIVATLGPSTASNSIIADFTSYYVIDYMATTITVPCSGSGVVRFTPLPASSTASPASLDVTFESQP